MIWLNAILAAVKLLSAVIQFLQQRRLIDAGASQQIALDMATAAKEVLQAGAAADEAEKRHAKDPTDAAFDPDFERKDP